MGRSLFFLLFACCSFFYSSLASAYDIDIGLTHQRNGAIFSSEGDIYLDTADGRSYQFTQNHSFHLTMRGFKVRLAGRWYELPVQLSSSAGWFRVGKKGYRGSLILRRFKGKFLFINHLNLEDYLKGVVSKEMPPQWPLEALKSQAVIARTYALYKKTHIVEDKGFDLYDSTLDQVYQGLDGEGEKGNRAVDSTSGIVITYKDEVIKSYYHSTSGGRTEDPVNVWGVRYPYLKSITCGFDRASPSYHWRYSLSTARLEYLLRKKGFGGRDLRAMKVRRYTVSGRNKTIELIYRRSQNKKIAGTELRQIVGNTLLKSTKFYAIRNGHTFTFIGKGSGHGVGLCQWGARGMAEKGYNFRDIIHKYYQNVKLGMVSYEGNEIAERAGEEPVDHEDEAYGEADNLGSFIENLQPSLPPDEQGSKKGYLPSHSDELINESIQYKELYR